MYRLKYASRAALLLAIAACTGDLTSPAAPDEGDPSRAIADAAHSGAVPGFYFLPPMVPAPTYTGTFDAGLQPRVEICELAGAACGPAVATFPFGSGSSSTRLDAAAQHYIANWNASKSLDPGKFYRVQVFVGTFRLGFADVDVVRNGKEKDAVDRTKFIPLIAGQALPVKFRVETGIVAGVVVSPDSATVAPGGTQQFTAAVRDLHGNALPGAPVAWSSSAPPVATVDGTGLATGVAPGQANIIATSGAASDHAVVTVFDPNTPPVAHADTFQAIGNVTVPVPAPGVLANDTDGENDALQAVAGTFPTTGGGTVTITADGGFSYRSAAGFTGTDSFIYTVTDGQDSSSASAAVVSAYRVWYVDASAAAPGDGRDASPFSALAGAEGASAAGETIFVRAGSYGGGIALKSAQSLTGQGVPADVTALLNGQTVVLLAAGSAPTVARASGPTVQLATNNVIQGLNVTSSAGAGIAGAGFGTLAVSAISVAAEGGPALDLSSGDVTGAFTSLSSTGSAGSGIRLLGVGGSFSAVGGSITNSAAAGVDVTGGAGSLSYGGNIAVAGPLAVSVTGRTGGALAFGGTLASTGQGIAVQNNAGGSVAFTGSSKSLATGANPGVLLANNTGAQVSFAGGGLVIGTTSGTGFEVAGGGTVTVTGAGNTVSSAGGAAVRVQNTTIGVAGLSFRSVSASGGPHGIVLVNTGALNGMQVTGAGVAGSGGTIQAMSAAGVHLDGARNVSLSAMTIQNNAGSGIGGKNVTEFGLDAAVVSGNGNSASHGGLVFDGLFGTSTISASTITGSFGDNAVVRNGAGMLSLAVTGTTISSAAGGGNDGLRVEAAGAASMAVNVSGSTFAAHRGDHFQAQADGAATLGVIFANNALSGGHPGSLGQGIALISGAGFTGAITYDINANTIRGSITNAVTVAPGASTGGTFSGQVRGNTIGAAGAALSCSAQGSGIVVDAAGNGTHTTAVTGNHVRQCFDRGISSTANEGAGVLNLTVTGNTVAELVGASSREGFFLNAGSFSLNTFGGMDGHQVCLALGGAGALSNSLTNGPSAVGNFRLRQRFGTTVRLPGYAGANINTGAVVAFVSGNNGGASGTATVASPPGGGFVGGASCPSP